MATASEVMAERSGRFSDAHHPAFLHPLRTSTLLLEFGERSPDAHRGILLLDTEGGSRGDGLPDPPAPLDELASRDPEELLEGLLLAERWVRSAWLAERLDHIRHLHLWAGAARTAAALDVAEAREAPLAAREGGRCARAWADWMDKARRFRLAERAEARPVRDSRPG